MPRKPLPQLNNDTLQPLAADETGLPAIRVGTAAWFAWLEHPDNQAFSIPLDDGTVTVRRERQGNTGYWYAYRRHGPTLHKAYLGKPSALTLNRLQSTVASLAPRDQAPGTADARLPLQVRLLGKPTFTRGDAHIAAPASKAVALLAYLALHSAPQSREHLLALLWPESAEDAARKNLRNLLWSIRTTLGPEVLLTQDEQLALHAELWVDLPRFEQHTAPASDPAALRHALDRYHGPLLAGVTLVEAAEFDLWLAGERERLTQRFVRAAEQLVAHEQAAGAWDAVVAVAQRVLRHDPLQEWPYRALMEAHARRGDRATALRQYELLRSMLDRELDVAPAAETEAVHDAIIRGAFERDVTPPPQRMALRMNRPSAAPFVGRVAERAALDAALAALGSSVRVAVLSGEMGIGKSRLWQVWAASVGPSTTVLEARCLRSTLPMPFAPLIGLFSQRIWSERFADIAGTTPPPWLSDLSPLLPTLQHPLVRPLLSRIRPEDERHRVLEAFVQALQALAAPPLVLFVDDLHWADAATLDWLDYLAHRGRDLPLLLVLAYRSEDAPRSLLQRIAQWDREGMVSRVALDRLTVAESSALLHALAAPVADLARIYKASAGNPYFLAELAQVPPGDLPPALADLVRARLDRLPEAAQQVLQAAAVLEPDIDVATVWRIAGRSEDETLDALDALLQAAVLSERGDRYLFTHPLVASLVREDLSRARRATLHRRAATALEQRYARREPAQAGRIMAHFREAGDMPQTAHYAELAGDHALTVAAPAEAAAFYAQALALAPTATRHLGLGRAQAWQGDLDAAWRAFEQALLLFQHSGDDLGTAWVLLQLADLGTMRSQFDVVTQLAEQALTLAADRDPALAAAAHVLIGTGLRAQGASLARAEAELTKATQIATHANLADILTYCYVGLSNIRAEQGDLHGAFAAAQAIIGYAQQSNNPFYTAVGYNNAAHRAVLLGNHTAAHAHLAAGLQLVEEQGLEVPRQWLYSTRGELALAEQAWDDAEHWFQRGMAHAERSGNQGQIAMYQANLGLAARGRGDGAVAVQLLEQARAGTAHETAAFQQAQIDLWLAESYAQQDDHAAAAAALARVEARLATGAYPQLQPGVAAVRTWVEREDAPSQHGR